MHEYLHYWRFRTTICSVSRYSFVEFPKFRKQLDVLSEYEVQNGAYWGYIVLTPTSLFCCVILSLQNLKGAFCVAFHVQKWNTGSWNFVIMFGPIRKCFAFALFSEWKHHSLEPLPCYRCSYQGCYFKRSRRIFYYSSEMGNYSFLFRLAQNAKQNSTHAMNTCRCSHWERGHCSELSGVQYFALEKCQHIY